MILEKNESSESSQAAPSAAPAPRRTWLSGFRRITSSGNYIPEIDGLRFVAIAGVVLHHITLAVATAQHRPQGMFELGQKGVELFFVISGFVLAAPFAAHFLIGAKRVRLRDYFVRRITRLEPPYLLSLLLLFAIKNYADTGTAVPNRFNLLYSLFYVHGPILGTPSLINGVAWSLEIEVQFYILMPLLALIFLIPQKWIRRGIMIGLAIAFMLIQPLKYRAWLIHYDRHLLNYIQYFLAGMFCADVFVTEWRNAPPAPRANRFAWGDIVWLIGWPVAFLVLIKGGLVERFTLPAIFIALFIALFHSTQARRLMRISIITVIGGMCYSIYLLHNAVIQWFAKFGFGALSANYSVGIVQAALIAIPLILIVCGLFFRLIERPCMRRDWPARVRDAFINRLFIEEDEPTGGPASNAQKQEKSGV